MSLKLFSFFLCTIYCVRFVCGSPNETKNETDSIKIIPTNITIPGVTTLVPQIKDHADVKSQNKTNDAKNVASIPEKTTESHGGEPVPGHTETVVTTANTTTANTTAKSPINGNSNKTQDDKIPTNSNGTVSPAVMPTKATTPSEVTTPKPQTTVTISSTTTHTVTILPTSQVQEKEKDGGFNGPSFIGGIVLALGLTGIGFVAYKFCKARNDRNYRNF